MGGGADSERRTCSSGRFFSAEESRRQTGSGRKLLNVTSAGGTVGLYLGAAGESAIKSSHSESVCSPPRRFLGCVCPSAEAPLGNAS